MIAEAIREKCSEEQRQHEKAYRRASVRKHIAMVRLMRVRLVPNRTVDRERRLVGAMFQLYREA